MLEKSKTDIYQEGKRFFPINKVKNIHIIQFGIMQGTENYNDGPKQLQMKSGRVISDIPFKYLTIPLSCSSESLKN